PRPYNRRGSPGRGLTFRRRPTTGAEDRQSSRWHPVGAAPFSIGSHDPKGWGPDHHQKGVMQKMSKRLRMLVALATVAAMMLSLAGIASAQFSDVDKDADYADAVELLAELKVAQGYPDGSFGVDNPMTRQEFAAFVVRAMGREAMAQSFSNARTAFQDDAEIAP